LCVCGCLSGFIYCYLWDVITVNCEIVQLKRHYTMTFLSWFVSIRIAVRTVEQQKIKIPTLILNMLILRIHPPRKIVWCQRPRSTDLPTWCCLFGPSYVLYFSIFCRNFLLLWTLLIQMSVSLGRENHHFPIPKSGFLDKRNFTLLSSIKLPPLILRYKCNHNTDQVFITKQA